MNSVKRYLQFVQPYKKQIFWTIVIGIFKFGIPLLIPLILQYVIDDLVGGSGTVDERTSQLIWLMAGLFILFAIVRPPIEYYRQYFAQWTSSKILYDIREKLFSHLQQLSLKYYANTRAGEVISRVINDVEQTKTFVITGLMNIWLDLITIVIAIAIMLTMDIKLTIVSILLFPLYGFSIKFFYGRLRQLTRVRSQALAQVQGYLHERVSGMPVIRSFAIEKEEQERFNYENEHFLNRAIDHTKWNALTFSVVNTITELAPLLVIGVAGYEVIQGNMTVGTMVAFVTYIDRLYNPLRRLINSSTTLTQSIASMDRVFELLDEKYDIEDKEDAIEPAHLTGKVEFRNVHFKYQDNEPYVLKGINLKVEPGETVAFVGMSGGGKSTLISLIPRFYDATEGSILVDDLDIRDLKSQSLRNQIGLVHQDNFLFSESIKDNILIGKPHASGEEVIEAAKAANAHDFISSLPNGYETRVGERGVKLSGGQKQRVAMARVFIKNPPLLILDEATSALDLESEQFIQEALDVLAKNRTTFVIAHRLSTITHADKIVLIEDGGITEMGTHQQLMAKKGNYFNLFQIQQLE
ncbi:ABC transporter ATP-binding protein [Bacillus carboniphilus]|uniref:ABC transporter ATP-binding protein n=1 Tax=Bacillus carboniphilus TaxID=86663 RepID=A0ABY9JTH0_9BACI|nr:ABC transporter ATP-binding protein [Bacillus carboniphilus]WLR42679.1 ABC transporter ATP-binding protein [Bacillus carboniphilus]